MRGSSPLARGLLPETFALTRGEWIIPARAGFTSTLILCDPHLMDHPRSRGVYGDSRPRGAPALGSSPLARGLPLNGNGDVGPGGIIPARAGFTSLGMAGIVLTWDHPRSRGVYYAYDPSHIYPNGSSPLARGLRDQGDHLGQREGIIPARAGFTPTSPSSNPSRPDHPRSRGVYLAGMGRSAHGSGSSPLARGLPLLGWRGLSSRGIIPARAGFTPKNSEVRVNVTDHPRSRGVYTCESLESQRTRSLPDPRCLHCRPRARSAELR